VKDQVYELARGFSKESHGSSTYGQDQTFIKGEKSDEYVPLTFVKKNIKDIEGVRALQAKGFVYSSADYLESDEFAAWYKKQFNKKLSLKLKKGMGVLHYPEELTIYAAIESIVKVYDVLRSSKVINNGKNLPVQLGEWYAKCVFGLRQMKSSSQRGFDFYDSNNKRVEVVVNWSDRSSPKGIKVKKSLVDMSDFCIVIYMADNFMIRDILMLDSDFINRKLSGKGHTVFLKDINVANYFFSVSSKQFGSVVNKNFLMKFSSPSFAMKLEDRF
jgi:hypothetical protein